MKVPRRNSRIKALPEYVQHVKTAGERACIKVLPEYVQHVKTAGERACIKVLPAYSLLLKTYGPQHISFDRKTGSLIH